MYFCLAFYLIKLAIDQDRTTSVPKKQGFSGSFIHATQNRRLSRFSKKFDQSLNSSQEQSADDSSSNKNYNIFSILQKSQYGQEKIIEHASEKSSKSIEK